MKKRKADVLNLEWTAESSRDREAATLVCNYLRYMGYNVIEKSIFNGYHYINKYRPRIYFNISPIGANINMKILRYAYRKNIKIISSIGEGNFFGDSNSIDNFIWGWNIEKKPYEEKVMLWSQRTKKLITKKYPEYKNRYIVSGCIGIDRYKIVNAVDKNKFLLKHKKNQFSKIIGFGCWDFACFFPYHVRFAHLSDQYKPFLKKLQNDRGLFNKIMKDLIEKNNDILFLFKVHPGTIGGNWDAGIDGFEKYNNVLILKNEESIFNCISVSDFWMHYESTTAMEAWLLNKQTCMLNPSGIKFPRSNIWQGNINYKNSNELQKAIETFYRIGFLPKYKSLSSKRKYILKQAYEWDDGLNHVRAGNCIIEILKNMKEIKISSDTKKDFFTRYLRNIIWLLAIALKYVKALKLLKRYSHITFNDKVIKKLSKTRMLEQIKFYKKLNLDKNDLLKIKAK
ncbi:MAG: hypothetical protein OEZ22_03305 [Spirochaetia bacterium]|nr:hypothetical protein [Spirochaetia bacterium]